jgi:hypothetical protein
MPIPFDCPECGTPLVAPDHLSGDVWQCPQCESAVRVPGKLLGQHLPRPKQLPPRPTPPRREPSHFDTGFKIGCGATFGIVLALVFLNVLLFLFCGGLGSLFR